MPVPDAHEWFRPDFLSHWMEDSTTTIPETTMRTTRWNRTARSTPAVRAVALALVLGACGGDGGPTGPDTGGPQVGPVASIELNVAALTLDGARETTRLTAVVRDAEGRVVPGASVSWTSLDADVATVDADGDVTSVREGSTTISAAAAGFTASAAVSVQTALGKPFWATKVLPADCTGGCVNAGTALGADGTIYVATLAGELVAVAPDGAVAWRRVLNEELPHAPAVAADGTIYVGTFSGQLVAFAPDGSERWRYDVGSFLGGTPAIGPDGTIYVGDDNFLDGNNLLAITPAGALKWTASLGGQFGASGPVIAPDGTLYVGMTNPDSKDGEFAAIGADGVVKWRYAEPSTGQFSAPAAIAADGTVYVGTTGNIVGIDGRMFAFRPDGTVAWTFDTDEALFQSPALGTDGTIYVPGEDDLYAFAPDGGLRWSAPLAGCPGGGPTVGADGVIYVAAGGCVFGGTGVVEAFDPSGSKLWSYETAGEFKVILGGPSLAADGTLYLVTQFEGDVYAFRSSSPGLAASPWPKERQNNANTSFAATGAAVSR